MNTPSCPPSHPEALESPSSGPSELLDLRDRVRAMPEDVRRELEPIVADALEQARFRGRVIAVARDALLRLRVDLSLAQFDLAATRREREDLRRLLDRAGA